MSNDACDRANRLLDATQDWFPYPVDLSRGTSPELALAAFSRCRRLLSGMVALHEEPDLTGGFARTLYEVWLHGSFLLLDPDNGYERLNANSIHEQKRIARRVLRDKSPPRPPQKAIWENAEKALDSADPTGKRIDLRSLAEKVAELFEAQGDPNSDFSNSAYTFLFGPESSMSVHGGLMAFRRYILESESEIIGHSWTYAYSDHRLNICTAMTRTLAKMIANELDVDRQQLDTIGDFAPEI